MEMKMKMQWQQKRKRHAHDKLQDPGRFKILEPRNKIVNCPRDLFYTIYMMYRGNLKATSNDANENGINLSHFLGDQLKIIFWISQIILRLAGNFRYEFIILISIPGAMLSNI